MVHDLGARARPRLYVGAITSAYLAVWSAGYTGVGVPEHQVWLDALLAVGCVAVAWRYRRRLLASPAAFIVLDLAFERGVIPEPTTPLEWGVASVLAGFVVLGASLATTVRLGRRLAGLPQIYDSSPPSDDS